MKNNLFTKIKKNFTKKDATYLIVVGVLSGLLIGSFIGDGPGHSKRFEMGKPENISFQHKKDGHKRGHDGDHFWQDDYLTPEVSPTPAPSNTLSPTPKV